MSDITYFPQPAARQPLPARCVYVRGLFDQGLKVPEIIEKLDAFGCNVAELQWVIDNTRGKVLAWAKRGIKTAKEDPPN